MIFFKFWLLCYNVFKYKDRNKCVVEVEIEENVETFVPPSKSNGTDLKVDLFMFLFYFIF